MKVRDAKISDVELIQALIISYGGSEAPSGLEERHRPRSGLRETAQTPKRASRNGTDPEAGFEKRNGPRSRLRG